MLFNQGMVRQIPDMNRDSRKIALLQQSDVAFGMFFVMGPLPSEPVVGVALRVDPLFELLDPVAEALARHTEAFDALMAFRREGHVEKRMGRQRVL